MNRRIPSSQGSAQVAKAWCTYPRSIQLRSGCMVHKNMNNSNQATKSLPYNNTLLLIPNMIDIDILYINPFFARYVESYPRIGLSIWLPYSFQKAYNFRFPKLWAILGYIELYYANPVVSTWGNRLSIGGIQGGALMHTDFKVKYGIVAAKEITYHWSLTPSWQL